MSTTARTPFLGTYILIFLATMIGIGVVLFLISALTGVQISNGGMAILPPMIAAIFTGKRWGAAIGAVPENRIAWRFAIVAAIATVAVQILIALGVLAAMGDSAAGVAPLIAGAMVLYTALVIIVNRWFLGFGAKASIRAK